MSEGNLFYDAHKVDGRPGVNVVLVSAEYERLGHGDAQHHQPRQRARPRRHLPTAMYDLCHVYSFSDPDTL